MDDFIPYAHKLNTYWTGFFTSRPSLKLRVREGSNLLQIVKQLSVLIGPAYKVSMSKIRPLQKAMGILQHHDAITGTCRQHVADDYMNMLGMAMKLAQLAVVDSYRRLQRNHRQLQTVNLMVFCNQLNISSCDATETLDSSKEVLLVIYNPLARVVQSYIRVPVRGLGHRVISANGTKMQSEVCPLNILVNC